MLKNNVTKPPYWSIPSTIVGGHPKDSFQKGVICNIYIPINLSVCQFEGELVR